MCVLFIAYHSHPRYPLIVLANRDEFYDRPTAPLGRWSDHPHVQAGRDLVGGGTWLGATDAGKFAAVTNFRDPSGRPGSISRGHLVADFLIGGASAEDHLKDVSEAAARYSGFNLILMDASGLYYFSNVSGGIRKLTPGVYGLSNHLLNTPWPKVSSGIAAFRQLIAADDISRQSAFALLADETLAAEEALPDTGIERERERLLSPIFVRSNNYGTRSSTFVLVDNERTVDLEERVFV